MRRGSGLAWCLFGWFTEGLGTPDLVEAEGLLAELG